jgi:hypothetical protein
MTTPLNMILCACADLSSTFIRCLRAKVKVFFSAKNKLLESAVSGCKCKVLDVVETL